MNRGALTLSADPAERFAQLLGALCEIIAVEGARLGLGFLSVLIWSRITGIAARFARLATFGQPPARKPYSPPAPPPRPERPNTPPRPRSKLPAAYAWLARTIPATRLIGAQLLQQLAEPEMADFIAATPGARRLLRPLLDMLGLDRPAILRLPPRKPRPKPAPGEPPHIPKPRIHPVCDYQPGPRKDELRALRDAPLMTPRKIRI